jgi:hypothetical protein
MLALETTFDTDDTPVLRARDLEDHGRLAISVLRHAASDLSSMCPQVLSMSANDVEE